MEDERCSMPKKLSTANEHNLKVMSLKAYIHRFKSVLIQMRYFHLNKYCIIIMV